MQEIVDHPPSEAVMKELQPVLDAIRNGKNMNLANSAEDAYRGMMGFYNSQLKAMGIRSTEPLIRLINGFATQAGLSEIPSINEKAASKMGLSRTSGINVGSGRDKGSSGRGGDKRSHAKKSRGGSGYSASRRAWQSSSPREPSRRR